MAKETQKKISTKIKELEGMVDWFYSEEFNLDEAEEKYKKTVDFSREIEKDLTELKNRIEVINKDFTKD